MFLIKRISLLLLVIMSYIERISKEINDMEKLDKHEFEQIYSSSDIYDKIIIR